MMDWGNYLNIDFLDISVYELTEMDPLMTMNQYMNVIAHA